MDDAEKLARAGVSRRLLAAAGVALLALLPALAAGTPRVTSLNDVASMDAPTDCPKVEGKQLGAPTLTLAQAVERFNAALEASLSPQSVQALDADPAARNPAAATAIAARALLAKRPVAAAAYLLRAHRASPQDPDALVNLASLANYFSRHDEALAFVTGAAAVGRAPSPAWSMNGRATMLTVRGGALLGLDRAKEAEAALREAIALQPDLAEAYTGMAYALGEQGRCQEAVRYLVAGAYRDPPGILEPDLGTEGGQGPGNPPGPPATPSRPDAEERNRDVQNLCPPSKVAVDLSRGKTATLPRLPVATRLEEVRPLWEAFQRHKQLFAKEAQELQPVALAATKRLKLRADQEGTWLDQGTPSQRLTALRSRRLRHLVYCYTQNNTRQSDARLKRLYKMGADSLRDAGRRQQVALKRKGESEKAALDVWMATKCSSDDPKASQACSDRAEWKLHQAYCKSTGEYLLEVAPSARAFDQAERTFFMEAYQAATAAASYQGVPESTAYSRWVLKLFENNEYGRLVGGAESALGPIVADSTKLEKMLRLCRLPEPPSVEAVVAVVAPSSEPPTFCQLMEGSKVKIDLEVAEVSVGCEQVALEISAGEGIKGLVEVGYDWSEGARKKGKAAAKAARIAAGKRDGSNPLGLEDMDGLRPLFTGQVSVFVGAKAGIKKIADAKGGVGVTVDGNGNVVDVAVKGEVTGSVPTKILGFDSGAEHQFVEHSISFISTPGAKE